MQLTRNEFEAGALAWLQAPVKDLSGNLTDQRDIGWQWLQQSWTGHGYMVRSSKPVRISVEDSVEVASDSDGVLDVIDEASAASQPPSGSIAIELLVSYSPSYQVPVLYFRGYDTAGSPIALAQLLKSSFFRARPSEYPLSTLARDGDQHPDAPASFPAISQGEHPETSSPCYFLHPCEMAAVIAEVLSSDKAQHSPMEAMQTWFMLVSNVVDVTPSG